MSDMSNDFDRAVNFLQGALNAAAFEVAKEKQSVPQEPVAQPAPEPVAQPELQLGLDPLPEPEELTAPASPTGPVNEKQAESRELPTECPAPAGKLIPWYKLVAAFCVGLLIPAVFILCKPQTSSSELADLRQRLAAVESASVPLALLPETADADLWPTVANLHGTINGAELRFNRGIATVNGTDYRICLDFCKSGDDIYVKVEGNGLWVVRAAADGTILKAYPGKAGGKPLKDLFRK